MIINVGIKENQKKQINQIIKESEFSSANEFVQKAVEEYILKQKKGETIEDATKNIEDFLDKILEEELEDKIAINPEIAGIIKELLEEIGKFKFSSKFESKSSVLIRSIHIKDFLNDLIKEIEKQNKKFEEDMPLEYSNSLKDLKGEFISKVKDLKA